MDRIDTVSGDEEKSAAGRKGKQTVTSGGPDDQELSPLSPRTSQLNTGRNGKRAARGAAASKQFVTTEQLEEVHNKIRALMVDIKAADHKI